MAWTPWVWTLPYWRWVKNKVFLSGHTWPSLWTIRKTFLHKSFSSTCSASIRFLLRGLTVVKTLRIQITCLWRCKSRLTTSTFNLVIRTFFLKLGFFWRSRISIVVEELSGGAGRDPIAIAIAVRWGNGLVFNPEAKQYGMDWLVQLKYLRLQKRETASDQPFENDLSSVLTSGRVE